MANNLADFNYRSQVPLLFSYDIYNNLKEHGKYSSEKNLIIGSLTVLTEYLTLELGISSINSVLDEDYSKALIFGASYVLTRSFIGSISSIKSPERLFSKRVKKIKVNDNSV